MTAPQDHDVELLAAGGVPAALIRCKPRIAELFEQRVRASLPADVRLDRPMTIDTLPSFLTSIALALSPADGRVLATQRSTVATQHGVERARLTNYSLQQVLQEYGILRQILGEVLPAAATLDDAAWHVVHRSIDEAMSEAAGAFVQVHQQLRDHFTATLGHDLRGPLGAARSYAEIVLRHGEDPEHRKRASQRVIQNIDRVAKMIRDLLDASRARLGERIPMTFEACELRSLVTETLEDLSAVHGDRFRLDAPQPIDGTWCRDRLSRAVHNLVENALKYGEPGRPVTVRLLAENERAAISVHNFGEPIPEEERNALFRPFHRSASAERAGTQGWGLGLPFVQAVAEGHGGVVVVDSSADTGTTFTLDILQHAGSRS